MLPSPFLTQPCCAITAFKIAMKEINSMSENNQYKMEKMQNNELKLNFVSIVLSIKN